MKAKRCATCGGKREVFRPNDPTGPWLPCPSCSDEAEATAQFFEPEEDT